MFDRDITCFSSFASGPFPSPNAKKNITWNFFMLHASKKFVQAPLQKNLSNDLQCKSYLFVKLCGFYMIGSSWHFFTVWGKIIQLFHDGGPYHVVTSPVISSENQSTGFYIVGTSVNKRVNAIINLRLTLWTCFFVKYIHKILCLSQTISGQWSHFTPPKDIRNYYIFKGC